MNNEFTKITQDNITRYILESDSGTTTSGSVATVPGALGKVRKRGDNILAQEADKKTVPVSTPRNFVAKNAKTGGAGQHKDKKKAEKQGDVKHRKPFAEQGVAEAFPNPGSGSTGSSKEDKRIAAALRKKHIPSTPNDKKKGVAEENIVETKGAPKGFHFTKSGKLKRGDADQDGNGGPMLRTDPLDKQRNKVPAVSEGVDFFKVWESIKPEEVLVEEETVDPVALKKEADRIMELNIAARKAK